MAFYGLLFLALSSTLLLQFSLTTAQSFVHKFCLGANYTANSTFEANLKLLLSSISNNSGKFYTNTVGRTPDRVYGLFQCRVDFSSEDCNKCAVTATQEITTGCPYKKESVVFYDPCWLRYSDTPFFTVAELDEDRTAYAYNPNNASDPDKFNTDLTELMERLVSQAVSGTQLFSIGKENFTSSQNIYGLVQCTQDLSASNCSRCLGSAVSDLSGCCSSTEGGRVFKPSCIARFETFEFYQNGALLVPPAAPAPLPQITPGPNTNTTTGQEKKSSINIVAIVVPAVIAAVLLSIVIIFFCLRRKKGFVIVEDMDQISNVESLQLKLATVAAATENFSEANKLGEGGFGPVYKGKLSDGQEIAVKRLSRNSGQGVAEFKNEILLLAKLQHRNLVRLLGFCLEGEEKLLIYEFVTNASLDQFIFDPIKRTQLDWGKRYNIIGGIARGLLYLHEDSQIRIIHRDLKASNILLNDQMIPKISDFGTARLFMMDQTHANTRRIAGTFGYMPPEYVIHGHFSVKSDVFSFGVLVLELISGKKNTSLFETECADDLLCYAWRRWREGTALELLDPVLRDHYNENEVTRCIHIGLLCVQEDVAKRPTMATVVLMLSSYSVNLALPSPPPRYGSFTISGSMPHSNNEVSVTELCAR